MNGSPGMKRATAIALIDGHKNTLINPIEMLKWASLRAVLVNLPEQAWEQTLKAEDVAEDLSRAG
jgi:hypothetical protein